MDSLTQIVLGAAVGEAVLGKRAGNRALLYGAIAGTLPDLDIFAGRFIDTVSAIEIHRGISHSIVLALLLSPVLGWLVSKIEKKLAIPANRWALLFFLCLFTHSLLDVFTTWGTQLFWPLPYRLAIKSIFVIDPLYTLPFMICLIGVMRSKKTSRKRFRYNTAGLAISTAYLLLTLVLKGFAYTKFIDALEDKNITYINAETRPAPLNTILWQANVETADAYLMGDYSFFDTQPITFTSYPKNHEMLGSLNDNGNIKRLQAISEGWYTITENDGTLFFNDLRFGMIDADSNPPQYAFTYRLEEINGTIVVHEVPKTRRDSKALLVKLWNRIWGN